MAKKKRCEPNCNQYLPNAKSKYWGHLSACQVCNRIYLCKRKSASQNYPLRSMYWYWQALDGEQ